MSGGSVAEYLTWVDPWLMPVFSAWGVPVSGLEVWAFVLSLGMVWLNMRVNPWGWPLAIISSLMYGLLFARSQLYGEASLQLVFVVLSVWGWWQWLYGRNPLNQALRVQVLGRQGRLIGMLVVLLSWPALGLLLDHATDSDVPYMDAFPSAASLLGQWLLGRKYLENWPTWLVVNVFSVVLFAYKGLWLTFILYGLFAVLSWVGWRQWRVVMSRQ